MTLLAAFTKVAILICGHIWKNVHVYFICNFAHSEQENYFTLYIDMKFSRNGTSACPYSYLAYVIDFETTSKLKNQLDVRAIQVFQIWSHMYTHTLASYIIFVAALLFNYDKCNVGT